MKKLIIPSVALIAIMSLALAVLGQGKSTTLTGHLIDKMCSQTKTTAEAVAGHGKDCILNEHCLKSGLGVFSDGKYYQFDEKGTSLAKAALEKTDKKKGAAFKVVGTVDGDKMTVESISESK